MLARRVDGPCRLGVAAFLYRYAQPSAHVVPPRQPFQPVFRLACDNPLYSSVLLPFIVKPVIVRVSRYHLDISVIVRVVFNFAHGHGDYKVGKNDCKYKNIFSYFYGVKRVKKHVVMRKTYKIGILGAGRIARKMAATLHGMDGVEAYAVASRSIDKAAAFARDNGVSRAYGSYDELAADPMVDLVYVATPHAMHYEHARLCIGHGRPVLCEKAFTVNVAQAEELLGMARERGVFITEAIWTRYMPFSKTVSRLVGDGSIGTPMTLMTSLCYPVAHKERIMRPELGGGALLDLGVYALNFAYMAFGTDVVKVDSSCVKTPTGVDAQDSITLTYADGRMAVLQANIHCAGPRHGVICGDRGYIVVDNINNPQRACVYDADHRLRRTLVCPPQITGYEYEVIESLKAIGRGDVECADMPHAETLRVMRAMDSLRREWGVSFPADCWR